MKSPCGLFIVFLVGSTLVLSQPRLSLQGQQQPVREVIVSGIPGVIAAGSRWSLVWQGTDNADGIVGTPDGGLLFAQEQPKRVSKLDKADKLSVYAEHTDGAGSLALDIRGRVIGVQRTCTDPGLNAPCSEPTKIAIIHPTNERKTLADRFQGKLLGRLNDLVVDNKGGAYFTVGGVYYVNPRGDVSAIGENLRTNGIMLSPDEKTLYVTNGPVVVTFDVQPDGTVLNQRDFARLEAGGSGDGLAIDGDGRLYVTSNPGVQVFSAEGKYLGVIPTPRAVISVAFSGADKRTLYVVGSGALDADGKEVVTPPGVRNNAKSIFKIPMLTEGFKGRAK
ncbi:MAG: SMP-30/gluconolactonase/LRE family protein [Vicinamibacterales bacterium]